MIVAIIGAKSRNTPEDKEAVWQLMDLAAKAYPSCLFCTMITNHGIGMAVKEHAMERDSRKQFRYPLIAYDLHVYATGLSKQETAAIYTARNATMFELADIFFYFADPSRWGICEELIQERVIPAKRPYRIFLPGDPIELVELK